MHHKTWIVLLLACGLTGSAQAKKKLPPLGGSCTEIFSPEDVNSMEYTGQPQSLAVFGFVDQGKTEGEVTLRGEFQCPSSRAKPRSLGQPVMALCTDLILKRSDGRHFRVAVNFDDISEFDKYEAVHLRPGQDSLFFVAHPVTDSPELDSQHWLAVLNVETCEWTGMLLDYHSRRVQWPTVVRSLRLEDPQFKPEAEYLETAKLKDGFFTPETIAKVRAHPEKGKYVWLADNAALVQGKTQGTMQLQWYPWDETGCAPEKKDLVHGHNRYKDSGHIRQCNDDTKLWAWLFVADGYQEDTSTTPARIDGAQLTVETPVRRVVINLDTLAYTQLAKVDQAPATPLADTHPASVPGTVPSGASTPAPALPAVAPVTSPAASTSVPVGQPVSVSSQTPVQAPISELDEVVMSGEMQVIQMDDDAALDQMLAFRAIPVVSPQAVAVSTVVLQQVAISSPSTVNSSTVTVTEIPPPRPYPKADDNPVMDQLLFTAPVSSSAIVQIPAAPMQVAASTPTAAPMKSTAEFSSQVEKEDDTSAPQLLSDQQP